MDLDPLDDDVMVADGGTPPPPPPAPPGTPSTTGEASPPPAPGVVDPTAVAPADVLKDTIEGAADVDPEERLEFLRAEIEHTEDPLRQALLAHEVGEILESEMRDEPGAIKAYSQANSLSANLLPNLWSIRRAFWRRKHWTNLIKVIDVQLGFSTEPRMRATLLAEKGEVFLEQAGEADAATEAFEEALAVDPQFLPAILVLEKLYAERGDREALFRVGRAHADAATSPERKASVLLGLSRLESELPDADYHRRRDLLLEALEHTASPSRILDALEQIARIADETEDLADALSRRRQLLQTAAAPAEVEAAPVSDESAGASDESAGAGAESKPPAGGEEAFALARMEARIHERAGRFDAAWEVLRPWTASLPGDGLLYADLSRIAAGAKRFGDLAALLAERIAAAPQAPLVEVWKLERSLALARAGNLDEAAADLMDVATSGAPDHLAILTAERLAMAEEERMRLLTLNERELAAIGAQPLGSDAAEVRDWTAELQARRAAQLFAAGRLDEAMEACRAAIATVPGFALAMDILELICTQQQDWPTLIAAYRAELAHAPAPPAEDEASDDPEASAPSERVRYLLESLDDIYGVWAIDAAEQVKVRREMVARWPDSLTYRLRLISALESDGTTRELAEELVKVGATEGVPGEVAADCYVRAAYLVGEEIGDAERASELLRAAQTAAPGHLESMVALELLLRQAERYDDLARFYGEEAERSIDEEEVVRLTLRQVRVLEGNLGQPEQAADVLLALAERQPRNPFVQGVLWTMVAGSTQAERWADSLEAIADALENPQDRATLYVMLGEVCQDLLKDDTRAEIAYLRAFASFPQSATPLGAVAELAFRGREWQKLAEVHDEHLRSGPAPHARLAAEAELAWLLEGPLDDPTGAETMWQLVAGAEPPPPTVPWAQVRAAVAEADWHAVADRYTVLADTAGRVGDNATAAVLRARAGLVGAAAGVMPPARVGEILVEAAAESPERPELLILGTDLAASHSPHAAALLEHRLAALGEQAQARPPRDLALLLGCLYRQAGQLEAAADALMSALEGTVTDLPLLAVLIDVARTGGHGRLEALCAERFADAIEDDERAAEILRRAAGRAGDLEIAARLLHKSLQRVPDDHVAALGLQRVLVELGQPDAADDVLTYRLARGGLEPAVAAELHFARALVRLEHRGEPRGAAADFSYVLDLEPEHPEALERLGRLMAADGDYEQALVLVGRREDVAGHDEDPAVLRRIRFLLAELIEIGDGDSDGAAECLQRVISADPLDLEARERLHAMYLRAQRWDDAVDALRARYRGGDATDQTICELRQAAIYRDLVGNQGRAQVALDRARQIDPLSERAITELVALHGAHPQGEARAEVIATAIEAFRQALDESPGDAARWHFLRRLFEWQGTTDMEWFALAALRLIGAANKEDHQKYGYQAAKIARVGKVPLPAEMWATQLLPAPARPVMQLCQLVGAAAHRIRPRELGDLGVGKSERASTKDAQGPVAEIFTLAQHLGLEEFELYVGGPRHDAVQGISLSGTEALVIGSAVAKTLDGAARYRVGAALARAYLGGAAFFELDEETLTLLLAASMREGGQDGFGANLPQDRLDEFGKAVRKGLSRKQRKSLAQIAPHGARVVLPSAAWREALTRAVARVGLLVSGDLLASVAAMKEDAAGRDSREAIDSLVLFSVSTAHELLRKVFVG